MLTNKHGLPFVLVKAILNDGYSRGDSEISVTQLITPPYQRKLMETTTLVEDVSDRVFSLLGTSVHGIIERAAGPEDIVEERFFDVIAGRKVSGAADLITGKVLYDFKVTSVWSVLDGGKVEWEQQLNLLRYLALRKAQRTGDNRYVVDSLCIVAILRDWVKAKAMTDAEYPKAQAVLLKMPMWSVEKAASYMEERVKAHFAEGDIPPCTDEERWATKPVYAVMRHGRKTAVRLYETEDEANERVKTEGEKTHYVVHRPKVYRRCKDYCAVSHACPTYNSNPDGAF